MSKNCIFRSFKPFFGCKNGFFSIFEIAKNVFLYFWKCQKMCFCTFENVKKNAFFVLRKWIFFGILTHCVSVDSTADKWTVNKFDKSTVIFSTFSAFVSIFLTAAATFGIIWVVSLLFAIFLLLEFTILIDVSAIMSWRTLTWNVEKSIISVQKILSFFSVQKLHFS